jgi:ubiquinone/menaquinone biosynthesis C-methylase UbiE
MTLPGELLYFLCNVLPSKVREGKKTIQGEIGSTEAGMNYAKFQFERKVKFGLNFSVLDNDVLEVGTGHGGIATYLALNGARSVIAIDLNEQNLEYGKRFSALMFGKLGIPPVNVKFQIMNAERMTFQDETFDLIVCDNLIEHITNIDQVMAEMHRVLRKNGRILVPNFPSIYSKYGPHVKYGIGLPWVNLFFKEKTIVKVMHRIARKDKKMYTVYPGLAYGAMTFREIRKYKDLNYITHRKFFKHATLNGFHIQQFKVQRTLAGKILARIPRFDKTVFSDIFSVGTSAVLVKN